MIANTKMGTLNDILGTREKIKFPHRINFPNRFKQHKEMTEWCDQHCKGIWRINSNYASYVQFTESQDAMMFTLRWGSA